MSDTSSNNEPTIVTEQCLEAIKNALDGNSTISAPKSPIWGGFDAEGNYVSTSSPVERDTLKNVQLDVEDGLAIAKKAAKNVLVEHIMETHEACPREPFNIMNMPNDYNIRTQPPSK